MKKYIKNNNGVALPAVIIMMVVLTILAAGLGTYALNSLERVMYMDTQKQAYYLARAGVETGAYAYQKATTVVGSTGVENFVKILETTDDIVKSDNIIWLVPKKDANSGTMWSDLDFVAKEKGAEAPDLAIGYYTIEMVRSQQDVIKEDTTEESETATSTTPDRDPCVEIRCTAVCYDDKNAGEDSDTKTYVARGYIFPEKETQAGKYCDDEGYFIDDGAEKMDKNGEYTGVFDACAGPMKLTSNGIEVPHYSTDWDSNEGFFNNITSIASAFFKNLFNGILKGIFDLVVGEYPSFYSYGVYGTGSLTVNKPSDTVDTLRIKENKMGFYAFSTPELLKVDAGIDVEPSKGYYATVALYGNDIVVNGDINMAVYYVKSDSFLAGVNNVIATLGNRYRLGTVIIGASTLGGGSWYEYMDKSDGGVTTQGGDGNPTNCNRIFFNGNVSVKIYAQGGSTETYRVFNSGDICLFNGSYVLDSGGTDGTDDNKDDVLGIDLLKFFLDSVVEGAKGFNYGDAAKEKAQEIIDLYYSNSASYYANGNCPIRKLNVVYGTNSVEIDGQNIVTEVAPKVELATYIIQPSPTTNIKIYWGKPTVSGFDKQAS